MGKLEERKKEAVNRLKYWSFWIETKKEMNFQWGFFLTVF